MDIPPDKFVENFNILLYVVHLNRVFRIEDGKWGQWSPIIKVSPTGLEETADQNDFEERICVFQEFERRTRLD